jgi:hypothetical protein
MAKSLGAKQLNNCMASWENKSLGPPFWLNDNNDCKVPLPMKIYVSKAKTRKAKAINVQNATSPLLSPAFTFFEDRLSGVLTGKGSGPVKICGWKARAAAPQPAEHLQALLMPSAPSQRAGKQLLPLPEYRRHLLEQHRSCGARASSSPANYNAKYLTPFWPAGITPV